MNETVQLENEGSVSSELNENANRDEEISNVSISFFIYRFIAYADTRRSIAAFIFIPVSYTHLTLTTNREV